MAAAGAKGRTGAVEGVEAGDGAAPAAVPGAEAPAVAGGAAVVVVVGAEAGVGLGRAGAGTGERMAVVSGGLGRGEGFWAFGPGDAGAAEVVGLFINCLIRSTVAGSRLASALTLTSSPQR